jgi:hypothetical protein
MDQHEQVTIMVDDDACLSILSSVAERCGASVKVAVVTRLALMVPNTISPDPPRSRSDRHASTAPKGLGALPVRG